GECAIHEAAGSKIRQLCDQVKLDSIHGAAITIDKTCVTPALARCFRHVDAAIDKGSICVDHIVYTALEDTGCKHAGITQVPFQRCIKTKGLFRFERRVATAYCLVNRIDARGCTPLVIGWSAD